MAILGIDEVGRGPWAGPLVIGACILPQPHPSWTLELTDSKKLSPKKRAALNTQILMHASATALGWVTATEIDQLGLTASLQLATRRAVTQIQQTKTPFTEIIIDGTLNFLQDTPLAQFVTTLKKADLLIKEVSAASIIAKVARDRYMVELATTYPQYGFHQHVGYGTAAHRQALQQYGPCPEHRQSFRPIRELLGTITSDASSARVHPLTHASSPLPTTAVATTIAHGQCAETVVADYLAQHGHTILARNHKTKFYEIDIISTKDRCLFFTEVKYRQDSVHGSPLEMITAAKRAQMSYAATSYLQYLRRQHSPVATYQPQLAAAAVTGSDFQLSTWFPLDFSD